MNISCQSLGPLFCRGSTVLNFIYLFFKSGAAPSPCAGPALAWLRLYNTTKIDYAKSGNNNKKTIKLQPLNSITILDLFMYNCTVTTGMIEK